MPYIRRLPTCTCCTQRLVLPCHLCHTCLTPCCASTSSCHSYPYLSTTLPPGHHLCLPPRLPATLRVFTHFAHTPLTALACLYRALSRWRCLHHTRTRTRTHAPPCTHTAAPHGLRTTVYAQVGSLPDTHTHAHSTHRHLHCTPHHTGLALPPHHTRTHLPTHTHILLPPHTHTHTT